MPAASMIHYFRADRPGQSRGIPEITPALPLFAQLRRYTLAVLAAAETAADFAAVLFTDAPANGEADPVEPMDLVELERRMATVLPGGWKLGQIQAEQPSTDLRGVQEGNPQRNRPLPEHAVQRRRRQFSSGYNYASGRLDHQTYFKSIRVDQDQLGLTVLDRVLRAWLDEAILISELLPLWMRTAAFRDLGPSVVLGRAGARGSRQGSQCPGHAVAEPHDHAGLRIRPAGPRLGERTPPAGQGSRADERTGAAGRWSRAAKPRRKQESESDRMPTRSGAIPCRSCTTTQLEGAVR